MKKVLVVFGTRPEAIKMAPLVIEFKKHPDLFDVKVCVSGQHRQMLDQVLSLFQIVPDYDLNIMKVGQDLYDISSRVLMGMRDILRKVQPNVVIVHGDTTTSTFTALAAFYQQIPVAHIEAGLRTNNIYSPWPEEINRQLTGRLSNYHFAPTILSKCNLLKENVHPNQIFVTGNTVIDALHWVIEKIKKNLDIENQISSKLYDLGYDISRLKDKRKLVLITGHRRENFGDGFLNICCAIKDLCIKYPEVDFVYPMHLNPNVRRPIDTVFGINKQVKSKQLENLFFIEPLDYLPFVYLMNKSYLVLTDSGGIQEEAPGLAKPVLVMRNNTERPEAIEACTVKLIGTEKENITNEVSELIDNMHSYIKMSNAVNPYGDGKASEKIVTIFKNIEL